MANKTGLISTINGFLTAVITQLKVRNASLELVNVFFSPIVNNAKTSTSLTPLSITTPENAYIDYNLNFKKEGNKVFVNGTIRNTSPASQTLSKLKVFTINNSEYIGKTGLIQYINGIYTNGTTIRFSINDDYLRLASLGLAPFAYADFVEINGFYYTND